MRNRKIQEATARREREKAQEEAKAKGIDPETGQTIEERFEALQEQMPKFFKNRLEPVGLHKQPYPYYDGVLPPDGN